MRWRFELHLLLVYAETVGCPFRSWSCCPPRVVSCGWCRLMWWLIGYCEPSLCAVSCGLCLCAVSEACLSVRLCGAAAVRCLGSFSVSKSRPPIRPVLKHGPRSVVIAQAIGCKTYKRNESEAGLVSVICDPCIFGCAAQHSPMPAACSGVEVERNYCDPKDGELCLSRMKPEETLVEVRSGSDVQIDRLTWV